MNGVLFLKKASVLVSVASVFALMSVGTAFAHVTVKPSEVKSATYQVFTVNVPNEKDIPTVAVRLVIPENVANITPTMKNGWEIATKTNQVGDVEMVTEITWSGGEITDGLRDEFTFSAKTPDDGGELKWKAYQTYSDGTVVAWDQEEESNDNHSPAGDQGPLSVTTIINDDTSESVGDQNEKEADTAGENADRAFYLSITAVVVSLMAIYFATRMK